MSPRSAVLERVESASSLDSMFAPAPVRSRPSVAPVRTARIKVDKISSSSSLVPLKSEVDVLPELRSARSGDVIVVRVISENKSYNQLELVHGRMAKIQTQDLVVGVLGARKALKGFVGEVPQSLKEGEQLHLLNMGGVMGRCTGFHQELGGPIRVEFVGAVAIRGRSVNIGDYALPAVEQIVSSAPIVVVAGTCMHAGKTHAAGELIKQFTRSGLKVSAAKLSGVACLKDALNMQDHGALETLTFHDCGLPSTVGVGDLAPVARSIIAKLNEKNPDLIVVELGDGIIGGYNVDSVLADAELRSFFGAVVFCASDFVGAWGGIELLRQKGIAIDVITGSCTDSAMGVELIEDRFGVRAANALTGGATLAGIVDQKVQEWLARRRELSCN